MQTDDAKKQDKQSAGGTGNSPWEADHGRNSPAAADGVGEKNQVGSGGPNGPGTSGSAGSAGAAGITGLDNVGGPGLGLPPGVKDDAEDASGGTGKTGAGGKPGGTSGTTASAGTGNGAKGR
jgi:hypothetical protein